MELKYKQMGDVLIPDLGLEGTLNEPLNKYGRMHRTYLKEHRPLIYNELLLKMTLYDHCHEIGEMAQARLDSMMLGMMAEAGVTEQLKAQAPMKWVGLMNTLKAQAEEVILRELVYTY